MQVHHSENQKHHNEKSDQVIETTNLMIPGPAGRLSVRTKGLGSKPKDVLILVQASNMSGQMGYDFSFPGGENYSMMDALVRAGIGAVTFSIRGYALSDPPADPFSVQTEQAIEDTEAVVDWVRNQGFARPHMLGFSWGGRIAGRYVEKHAELVDRLVLMDPARGGNAPTLPAPTDPWWYNTFEFFKDRLEADFTDQDARTALAMRMSTEELKAPNGIRMEGAIGSPTPIDPTAITRPTMMLYGVGAAKAPYMQSGLERMEFFKQLATDDKAFVIIPGCGDYAHLQRPRARIYKAVIDFLKQG